MNLRDRILGRRRELASSPVVSALFVMGEKGGVGKSLVAEVASTLLDDRGILHTVAECEGDARLGRRLGAHVVHHRLGEHDARALARDPDRLNLYWDGVSRQIEQGPTIIDLGANASKPLMDWLAVGKSRAALRHGDGIDIALIATADASSLMTVVNSARVARHYLPQARIHIIFNGKDGEIQVDHQGIKQVLREVACETPIVLPVCRAPDWGILKNLGRMSDVVMMDEAALEDHGISWLRAGRAIEEMGEWLLETCEVIQPIVAGLIERSGT